MLKKIIAVICILSIAFSLYSCGYKETEGEQQIPAINEEVEPSQPPAAESEARLMIYNVTDTYEEEPIEVAVKKETTIKEKLDFLASELSSRLFNGNAIEVAYNEDENHIVIDLKDTEEKSWIGYFQGSVGGRVTEFKILKTFLQKNYLDNWIETAEIYYNGEPAFEQFDHFCLYEVYERSQYSTYFTN